MTAGTAGSSEGGVSGAGVGQSGGCQAVSSTERTALGTRAVPTRQRNRPRTSRAPGSRTDTSMPSAASSSTTGRNGYFSRRSASIRATTAECSRVAAIRAAGPVGQRRVPPARNRVTPVRTVARVSRDSVGLQAACSGLGRRGGDAFSGQLGVGVHETGLLRAGCGAVMAPHPAGGTCPRSTHAVEPAGHNVMTSNI